jgi:hypothetical protein
MMTPIFSLAFACYAAVAFATPLTVAPRATVNAILTCNKDVYGDVAQQNSQSLWNQNFQAYCVVSYSCKSYSNPTQGGGEWIGACLGCPSGQSGTVVDHCFYDEQK